MNIEFVKKEKDSIELELSEKEPALALLAVLQDNGVDAYTHDPHPLKAGFRLHVESKDALKDLRNAVGDLEKQWGKFSKELTSKL